MGCADFSSSLPPKLAGDCDRIDCRRGALDGKPNKHGALAPKLGARTLAAGGESRRFGGALSGRIWRSFKKGALPTEREAEAAEAGSEGGGGS